MLYGGKWVEMSYPYAFLDPVFMKNGVLIVLVVILLSAIMLGLTALAVKIDKKLFKKLEYNTYLKA